METSAVMMRSLWALLLTLAACSPASESGAPRDAGGSLLQRTFHIAQLEAASTPFVIPSRCMSACTMYLGLSTACAQPGGVFGFHSVSLRGPADPDSVIDTLNRSMVGYYPPRLAQWFLDEGPGRTRSRAFVMVPASELIARGEVRACAS